MEFESWERASFDLLSTILSICAGTFHPAGAMFASPDYLWFLLNKYTNNELNKADLQREDYQVLLQTSQTHKHDSDRRKTRVAVSQSSSQTPGDRWKRSNCWKLTWKALGNACSIYLVTRLPGQVPANTSARSKGKSHFCWLTLTKKDQKWGDLNWFLNMAFLLSTVQCPLQHCQDLKMWGHKADFKPEEQNKLLGLGRWKRTLLFSAV